MSFNFTENPIRFSHDESLLPAVDYVRAGDFYNIHADALLLCVGRIRQARDEFIEKFASECWNYFDALHDGMEEEATLLNLDLYKLVSREYPEPKEFMEFNSLFQRYKDAAKNLVEAERHAKTTLTKGFTTL